ncbi:MAG: hypothetical protein H6608_05270 [Flavobacteriales bacterium]|nr:hypothetical protein [Bacteroidota bacterium]MCB9240515.1 hypothetical protein [Flavobacteriales bacterium]
MKTPKSLLTGSALLVLTMFVSVFLYNCKNDEPEPADSYVVPSNITSDHIVGTSPCPQIVGDFSVWSIGAESRLDEVDSVVVINDNKNLDVQFKPTKSDVTVFESAKLQKCEIKFNCKPQTSVDSKITFKIYRKGSLVETLDRQVIVRVSQ